MNTSSLSSITHQQASAAAPRAFYLRNQSSSELHSARVEELPTLSQRPRFASKDEFRQWCQDIKTEHVFYTLVEPEFPGARSSGSNPPKFLHGIVADYDGAPESISATLPSLKFGPGKAPTWVTTTFSGKARLIWLFEERVPIFSSEVHGKFLEILARELRLKALLPGLDEGALSNPHTPFELGTDWRQPYGDVRIATSLVMLSLHDASGRAKWKVSGPDIPFSAAQAEVERRWPGRWVGVFEEGARGVRFWDPAADNQTGCTLRKGGVQAWTGECRFIPWTELLGDEFVRKYRQDRIGAAIAGTYFDGQSYWCRDEIGIWRDVNCDTLKRHLHVVFNLSKDSRNGPGEISQAVTYIDRHRRVDGAFPCLFMPDDVVQDGKHKFLNIARAVPVVGTGLKRDWGDGFPWLAEYLNGLFDDVQREVFLSWLSHFHQNAVARRPRKGHALFVAGVQSAGKTFLSQRVIGGLMGGFQEATGYVLGLNNFNEQLFYSPVWAVDDAVAAADSRRHRAYSEMVKKIVANPYQEFHAKFKKQVTHRFNGRLVVTLNDDPTSIRMLPQVEGSILDKMVILRAAAPSVSFVGAESMVEQELPAFADFLQRFQIPEKLKSHQAEVARFGHDCWHHPELLATAKESSDSNALYELLDMWRDHHFRGTDKSTWSGSATELMVAMTQNELLKDLVRSAAPTIQKLGQDLQNLIARQVEWLSFGRVAQKRIYTIQRPESLCGEAK